MPSSAMSYYFKFGCNLFHAFKTQTFTHSKLCLLTSMTETGNFAMIATWMPKLWSQAPGCTWYSSVRASLWVTAVTCWLESVGTVSESRVSSWKWVANRVKDLDVTAKCLFTTYNELFCTKLIGHTMKLYERRSESITRF